jgi:hypothetical protein
MVPISGFIKGKAFIPESRMQQDPGTFFIYIFGEYQHDTMGNNKGERAAQKEIDENIKTLPAPYNTMQFQHGL